MSRETSEPEMLMRFIEGLRQASGSAHQLAHAQQNPMWLSVRDALEAISANGTKLATTKAISRVSALSMLDQRQMKRA